MNDRDSLLQQLNELVAVRNMIANSTCVALKWSPSYYEGEDNLKDTMAQFVNLQYNRRTARLGVIAWLDKRIELMRSALE